MRTVARAAPLAAALLLAGCSSGEEGEGSFVGALFRIAVFGLLAVVGTIVLLALTASLLLAVAVGAVHLVRRIRR